MTMRKPTRKGVVIGATMMAAITGVMVTFTPQWEGMDKIARRDRWGTGHPVTYCYGETGGNVKPGTRFTKVDCDPILRASLPKYINGIAACATRMFPVKIWAALGDAAYNAGVHAVCYSPMLARMNQGDYVEGCRAFSGWRVTGNRQVLPGLIARRGRVGIHEARKSEMELCLEGAKENE